MDEVNGAPRATSKLGLAAKIFAGGNVVVLALWLAAAIVVAPRARHAYSTFEIDAPVVLAPYVGPVAIIAYAVAICATVFGIRSDAWRTGVLGLVGILGALGLAVAGVSGAYPLLVDLGFLE